LSLTSIQPIIISGEGIPIFWVMWGPWPPHHPKNRGLFSDFDISM
jgi:hypothetical protein